MTCDSCAAWAIAETVETFRAELVRRFGEPWYAEREALVGRLAELIVARTRTRAERLSLAGLWASEAFPQLELWIGALEDRAA